MSVYKVHDIVRRVKGSLNGMQPGDIARVREVIDINNNPYQETLRLDGSDWEHCAELFELCPGGKVNYPTPVYRKILDKLILPWVR